MDRQQALAFFQDHQPLPRVMSSELRHTFEAAAHRLQHQPEDPEFTVPLLLNAWNETNHDDLETFLIAALSSYPVEWLVPHIAFGLRDPQSLRRMWFGEVAREFPHRQYTEPLLAMLTAEENLERFIAACVLERIGDHSVSDKVRECLKREEDPEIVEVLQGLL